MDACSRPRRSRSTSELGRNGAFGTPYPPLVVQVNLERAVEHWQQQEAAFGIIGLGGVESVGCSHRPRYLG